MARRDNKSPFYLEPLKTKKGSRSDEFCMPNPESFRQQVLWRISPPKSYDIADHIRWLREGQRLYADKPGKFIEVQYTALVGLEIKLKSFYAHLRKVNF